MRRTFVIYKDATSSLPNLHQGVQESWPKQAQVSWINTNILSSQKFQSSNPTTLIFDKTQSSSIQKWLSTLRRVERGVSSSTSICCRPQDMNHVSLTPKRWIPGEILSFMKVLKWWNVCVCVCVCGGSTVHRNGLSIWIRATNFILLASDDSILRVFNLTMEKNPRSVLHIRCGRLDWFKGAQC